MEERAVYIVGVLRECVREFLMPGLVDTHIHAPQYVYTGTALDLPLLQWLNQYTLPTEASFKDTGLAKHAYAKAVVSIYTTPAWPTRNITVKPCVLYHWT